MPKPNKSSASSGTRKKQAAKKADKSGQPEQPGGKGGKHLTKAEKKALKNAPKQKIYVPPPKPPAPAIPDPLDAQGLARTLPAELVVVLRRLGKKDSVTRRKGLEEFKEGWTDVVVARQRNRASGSETQDNDIEDALIEALPVWLHNLPSLLLSPGHRSLALSIHSSFLSIPPIASSLQNTLALGLFPNDHQCRDVISTWLTACVEETGRRQGGPSESPLGRFEDFVTWETVDQESESASSSLKLPMVEQLGILVEYMEMAILRPHELHDEIHPAPKSSTEPSSGAATPKKGPKGSIIPTNFPSLNIASNKADEESAVEEESQKVERDSRYNLSGIVGLTYILKNLPTSVEWPERLRNLLASADLWNLIRPVVSRKEVAATPPVRRALYGLLAVLISRFESVVANKLLSVVGSAVLLNIWKETDQSVWGGTAVSEALIMLLTKFRNVWSLSIETQGLEEVAPETAEETRGEESDAESDEEDEDEDAEDQGETDVEKAAADEGEKAQDILGIKAYNQFLTYLQRGCNGCPNEGYPTVLVILSTLPADVLSLSPDVYRRFFTSLWAAFDSKLLSPTPAGSGPSPMYQFLTATIDCIVFLSVRAWRNGPDADRQEFQSITTEEIARVWSDGILTEAGRLTRMDRSMFAEKRLESTREAVALSKGVSRLAQESTELSNAAIQQICSSTRTAYQYSTATSGDSSRSILIPRFTVLCEALTSGYQADHSMSAALDGLTCDVFRSAIETVGDAKSDSGSRESYAKLLVRLLASHGELLHEAEQAESSLNGLMTDRLLEMLLSLDDNVVGPLCRDYVSWLRGSDAKLEAWQRISLVVDNLPVPRKFDVTQALLITWRNTQVPVRAEGTAWSHIVLEAAEYAGKRQEKQVSAENLVSAVILHADDVVDKETRDGLLVLITTAITSSVNQILETGVTNDSELSSLQSQLEVIRVIAQRRITDFEHSDIHQGAIISLFELQCLADLLEPSPNPEMLNQLQHVLNSLKSLVESQTFQDRANARLLELLDDTACRLDPAAIIGSLQSSQKSRALLPTTSELCRTSNGYLQALLQKSLSASPPIIFDDLLPYEMQENVAGPIQYDMHGRSSYARRMEAMVALLRSDRGMVRESADTVYQLIIMDRLLSDELDCRGSSLGLYASDISREYVQNIGAGFHDLASYAMNSLAAEAQSSWHMDVIAAISRGTEVGERSVLTDLFFRIANASESDNLSPRVLRQLLNRVLSLSGDVAIIERWLACSQNLETKKPMITRAILHAVVPLLQRFPRLDRVRNDIASRLTAVPIAKAGSEGLRLIRNLSATAPSADSEDVFLPEQRTIFVMQHLTSWLTSAEEAADEMPEEVEARICLLFAEFLPIVQGRPGAHWNSVFDMITNNLEACSLADESTYNLASSTLHLLARLLDLSTTNKALLAEWSDRDVHARLVLDLFVSLEPDTDHGSSTKNRLIVQICDLLAALGNKTLDAGVTSRLYSMLAYDNLDVQRVAYHICREFVVRETADLVIEMETAIDAEDSSKTPLLPAPLLKAVASSQGEDMMPFGILLSWMLLFDHFKDASASLRSAYSDQLRETGAIHDVLMAHMPSILRQACSGTKSNDSVYFAVDEFHLELLEMKTDQTEIALSTHVFYRALENVPQLVRNWYEACKDRQLAMSFIAIVTRHISPVLIEHEFAVIREPGVLKTLEDDSLTVRVLSASAEITARYTIDEQPMEIVIKLPQEYPLRNVEVKEVNRVGVTEGKWRGWMMNVQQLVMSRNGLLLEALKLFKSNVSLHFEGKTECSICYSIISMNDRSLPSRACPTCKNKYHANCLFTWFKSSNSSTCPMCRSLF